jgi:SAM-dependent methyltransferase
MAEQATDCAARLARTKSGYETDDLLSQYLSLHFGPMEAAFAEFAAETGILASALDFPKKCGLLVNAWQAKTGSASGRALDLGCAVGGSTFELAKTYGAVIGIDLSQRFIDAAADMAASKQIKYQLKVEGELTERLVARLDPDVDTSRVQFMQVGWLQGRALLPAMAAWAAISPRR